MNNIFLVSFLQEGRYRRKSFLNGQKANLIIIVTEYGVRSSTQFAGQKQTNKYRHQKVGIFSPFLTSIFLSLSRSLFFAEAVISVELQT